MLDFIKIKKNINSKKKFYILDKSKTGESCQSKIKHLKKYFNKNSIEVMLVTSTENVAWLLNIRGNDSNYSPIPNCILLVDELMRMFLFCDLKKIDTKI